MEYMTNLQVLEGFEREINKLYDNITKPNTSDSLFWINLAIYKFIKLRFNGDFVHKTSYEQNEKRRKDLINLYSERCYTTGDDITKEQFNGDYQEYTCEYPIDFMYVLNEDVLIQDSKGENKKHVSVFECTQDSFMYRIMNSLTDFHYKYKYARPIRICTDTGFKLLTDGKYNILNYTIGYLRYPAEINLEDWNKQYTDFPKDTMHEIIKIAAQMYIENTKDERYNTISAEVNTQE